MTTDTVPRISVVILSYNFGKYLKECLESVLAQTLRPFEIIVCDDHSTDESWAIIGQYGQRYPELVKGYRHETNMGPARNGNFARGMATGDLTTWLDGDDRWLPQKLEMEWEALQEHPNARIAFSNVYTIDWKGNRTGIWHDGKGPLPPSGDVFIEVFSKRFFPNTHSIFRNHLMYRSASDEVGEFDEDLESYWDWDRKIRLTARFPVAYSGEALVEYRSHAGGFSRREPEKHFRAMVKVYEKNSSLLDNRSRTEAAWVRCNIESLITRKQIRLPPSDWLDYYSASRVHDRNRALLDELPEQDCAALEKELGPLFAELAQQVAKEEIKKGNRRRAFHYWLESLQHNIGNFDLRLVAQLMLPRWMHTRLRAVHWGLRAGPADRGEQA